MPESFLWAIDYHGSLYKLKLDTNEWSRVSRSNLKSRRDTFKRIASTKTCAWAIGGDQDVYMSVFQTDLPIRIQEETYENQRWSVRHGWSEKSRLFTDRWHWSSKNGKKELRKDSFQLISPAWEWEGDWFVDESIDCDVDGWQYAIDFPAQYHKSPGKMSFVRRRKWIRKRIFTRFDQWNKVETVDMNDPFQDISIGGYDIPGQTEGFLVVWGITFLGKVFYRNWVTRNTPEGDSWIEVPTGDLNLVQISVGPLGLLWGCTWDGKAVVRSGVTYIKPYGDSWLNVETPLSNVSLIQVVVGTKSLWALSKEGKVYFRRGIGVIIDDIKSKSQIGSSGSKWVEMYGNFSFISVGPNEQVWAIGMEDRNLYYRTNITKEELVGREWKRVIINKSTKQEELDFHVNLMNLTWINTGSCIEDQQLRASVSSVSISYNDEDKPWRSEIWEKLHERNMLEKASGDGDNTYETPFQSGLDFMDWIKKSQCQLLVDMYYNIWCTCYLKLLSGTANNNGGPVLYLYFKRQHSFEEIEISLAEILCIHRVEVYTKRFTFKIQLHKQIKEYFPPDNQLLLSIDNEKDFKDWVGLLSPKCDLVVDKHTAFHLTSKLGDIFTCFSLAVHENPASKSYWYSIEGNMKRIVSGYNHLTWGISWDGKPYVYNKKRNIEQSTIIEYYVYENQRWNPVQGYSDRLLPSDRWNWSDKTGIHQCKKDQFHLPSSDYKWISDWCIDYHDNTDRKGWQYAVDFPRSYHTWKGVHDYVRRRRWKRPCKATWQGPWVEVPTDVKIQDISINIDGSLCNSVWVVSCNGDLMVRKDVTYTCPQGDSWECIPTDVPISSVSVGANQKVWCVAVDGSCYLRAGFSQANIYGTTWFHILKEEYSINYISVGRNVVLALDGKNTLYVRTNVTSVFPEGTSWEALQANVSDVSLNSHDQVYFLQDNELKLGSLIIKESNYELWNIQTLLKGDWNSISARGSNFGDGEPKDDTDSGLERENSCSVVNQDKTGDSEKLDNETVEKIDPYKVDIYSFYANAESENDILGF